MVFRGPRRSCPSPHPPGISRQSYPRQKPLSCRACRGPWPMWRPAAGCISCALGKIWKHRSCAQPSQPHIAPESLGSIRFGVLWIVACWCAPCLAQVVVHALRWTCLPAHCLFVVRGASREHRYSGWADLVALPRIPAGRGSCGGLVALMGQVAATTHHWATYWRTRNCVYHPGVLASTLARAYPHLVGVIRMFAGVQIPRATCRPMGNAWFGVTG